MIIIYFILYLLIHKINTVSKYRIKQWSKKYFNFKFWILFSNAFKGTVGVIATKPLLGEWNIWFTPVPFKTSFNRRRLRYPYFSSWKLHCTLEPADTLLLAWKLRTSSMIRKGLKGYLCKVDIPLYR